MGAGVMCFSMCAGLCTVRVFGLIGHVARIFAVTAVATGVCDCWQILVKLPVGSWETREEYRENVGIDIHLECRCVCVCVPP